MTDPPTRPVAHDRRGAHGATAEADPDAPTGPVPALPGAARAVGREGAHRRDADTLDGIDGADDAVDRDATDDAPDVAETKAPTLLEQMGGVSGIIASGVPIVVFVVVQALFSSLTASIVAAVASAVLIAGWRLFRGEPVQPAISGLLGVAVCAFIAHRTGQAKGFFLLGIWTSLIYGGVFLISVLARWPLVGVIWHAVNGQGQTWRANPALRRAFDIASLAWVVVFAARFVVQRWLYDSAYADDWLGYVRLAMGIPLAALAALVTIWAIRRSQREHADASDDAEADAPA